MYPIFCLFRKDILVLCSVFCKVQRVKKFSIKMVCAVAVETNLVALGRCWLVLSIFLKLFNCNSGVSSNQHSSYVKRHPQFKFRRLWRFLFMLLVLLLSSFKADSSAPYSPWNRIECAAIRESCSRAQWQANTAFYKTSTQWRSQWWDFRRCRWSPTIFIYMCVLYFYYLEHKWVDFQAAKVVLHPYLPRGWVIFVVLELIKQIPDVDFTIP